MHSLFRLYLLLYCPTKIKFIHRKWIWSELVSGITWSNAKPEVLMEFCWCVFCLSLLYCEAFRKYIFHFRFRCPPTSNGWKSYLCRNICAREIGVNYLKKRHRYFFFAVAFVFSPDVPIWHFPLFWSYSYFPYYFVFVLACHLKQNIENNCQAKVIWSFIIDPFCLRLYFESRWQLNVIIIVKSERYIVAYLLFDD